MSQKEGIHVFIDFLKSINASEGEAARSLGITRGLISHWKRKGQRPGAALRVAISKWSRGRVPEACWWLPEEEQQLRKVQPIELARLRKAAAAAKAAKAQEPPPGLCVEAEVDLCQATS